MRIGIVTQSYHPRPGGVTEVVHYTAEHLRRVGHEVTIITAACGGDGPPEPDVLRIGRNMLLPVNGAWVNVTAGIGLGRRMERIFRERRLDIVQTHCPLVPTLPLLALRAAADTIPVVGTFHAAAERNAGYHLFRGPLDRRARILARRVAVSRAAARFANRYFPGDYDIVPNGIDCDRFNPRVPPVPGLDDEAVNLLYVGRLDRRKGVEHLLRAVRLARRRSRRPIRLVMVGADRCHPMLRGIARDAPSLFVNAGRVPPAELPGWYAAADCCCFPATGRESFGIVLLEAMATGVPVIASDIPGFRDVVTHGVEGELVPPRDVEGLAAAMVRLAGDEKLRRELGRRGPETARRFDCRNTTMLLEKILLETLGLPARHPASETAGGVVV